MFYLNSHQMFSRPAPAIMWQIEPRTQIITIRPLWDPLTKLVLPKELDEYYLYGHMLSLANLIKRVGFYPPRAKYMQIVRRNLSFFRQGNFVHLGENIIIDPWYFEEDKPAQINYYNPLNDREEMPKVYGKRK